MKIVTSMLTIASIILWLVILFFSVTSVYSVLNVVVNIGEAEMLPSSNGVNFSLPFSISNGGYYEIADLNLTTRVSDPDGAVLDLTETLVNSIPQGSTVNATHTIEVALDEILSMNHLSMLLNDSDFNVEIFAGLNFARAVPVQLSTNVSLPWGAPFANFAVGDVSVSAHNRTYVEVSIPLSFENHAVIDVSGTLKLEFYDNQDARIASGQTALAVAPQQSYADSIRVYLSQQDASKLVGGRKVHILFETPLFTVDWWEPYG